MNKHLLFTLLAGLVPLIALAQGPLPAPGAPGPTMKTLDQIDAKLEKRIPIDSTHTPGDDSNEFIIKTGGSYYLTDNLTTSKTGILVLSPGVTIDLSGFQIKSGTPTGDHGIIIYANDCTIKNGSISGFGTGLGTGIAAGFSVGKATNLIVSGCKFKGISVIGNWQITDCVAYHNGSDGIEAYSHSILTRCSAIANASANPSSFGIRAGFGCTLVDCLAGSNSTTNATPGPSTGGGIAAGDGSTLRNCTAEGNAGDGIQATSSCTLIGCTSTGNGTGTTGSGIATDIRAHISGCTAIGNKGDGIVFSGDSFVLNNHASKNGGAGFHDIGGFSRIDGNVSRENTGMGIQAGGNDTVVRNNSGANGGVAYGPTAGANWGPVGTANTATSPWANF